MKTTIGIMTLLFISQSAFAADTQSGAVATQLIESDAAVSEAAPTKEVAAPAAKVMKEQSGFSRGSVVRSAFTRTIDEREPTENLQNLTNESAQVKFFTELRDMSGQTAIHRWEYDGKVVAEVEFNVKGPRWRVWSSKSLVPQWTGDWKVSVINGAGEVISEKNLSYNIAAVAPSAASEPEIAPAANTPAMTPETMQ